MSDVTNAKLSFYKANLLLKLWDNFSKTSNIMISAVNSTNFLEEMPRIPI